MLVVAAVMIGSGVCASSIAAKPAGLRFLKAPARAFQGKVAVVSVNASHFTCTLSARFSDGQRQDNMFPTQTLSGKVTWHWKVPDVAAPGLAKLTAACPGAGKATKNVIVVGNLIPPRITVFKQGFSLRVRGNSESVSYGIVLRNMSPNGNALDVSVLVNFVMPDNHLIGSTSTHVAIINANSPYYLGGQMYFQGAPPIQRLEVVINPGGRARSAKSFQPGLDNVHLVPNLSDPTWLGSVEGDLINVHPTLALTSAGMSCVIFDAYGNILGGGSGSASFTLLPGTRSFFKLSSGFDAIPFTNAATEAFSITPSYATP